MSRLQVLLVEDNPANRELVRLLLELEGHEVAQESDCAGLKRRLAEGETFAVVLLDIDLPDCDGTTLVPEVRRRQPEAALIAVTAHAVPSELARIEAAGFDRVITKPIDTRTFAAEVEATVAEVRAAQAERSAGSPAEGDE